MNILARIQSVSLKCLILAWLSYWITLAWNQIICTLRYYDPLNPHLSDPGWVSVGRMCIIALISLVLGWKYLSLRKDQQEIPPNIWLKLCKQYPALPLLKLLALLFTTSTFTCMTLFFTSCSIDHTIAPIAVIAETFKNYELAERIYKQQENKQADLSLASWHTVCVPEDDNVRYARNQAVAQVYGDHSLEMVERYIRVGDNFNSGLGNACPEQTFYWYQKALELATSPLVADKAFYALQQMSLVRNDQKLVTEEKKLMEEARVRLNDKLDINHFGHNRLWRYQLALDCAWGGAVQSGNNEYEQAFKKQIDKVERVIFNHSKIGSLIPAIIKYGSLLVSLALTIGPLRSWLKGIFLFGLYRRERKRLSKNNDISSKLDSLDTMMSIDLYRQNFKQAWQHSIDALKLVNMETGTLSNDSTNLAQEATVKKTLFAQVHATLFILLFLAFLVR